MRTERLDEYQHQKTPDVWSQALWLGAALKAMAVMSLGVPSDDADDPVRDALAWIERTPAELKAMWPGVFPEFPYAGESAEDHQQRYQWALEGLPDRG